MEQILSTLGTRWETLVHRRVQGRHAYPHTSTPTGLLLEKKSQKDTQKKSIQTQRDICAHAETGEPEIVNRQHYPLLRHDTLSIKYEVLDVLHRSHQWKNIMNPR